MLGFHFGIPGGKWKAGFRKNGKILDLNRFGRKHIHVEKYSMCVFFENTRTWNRMQEMDMVRLSMIFIAMGIRVGSTYIVEIIKLMFKTTAASIWPLSQYG